MNDERKVFLIDTSYVVFAKWYSALSWYKMSINRNPDVSQLLDSVVFQNKLAELFEGSIMRVLHAQGFDDGCIVFAKDCSRHTVWRRSHFESYKEGRTQNGNFNSEAFNYIYTHVIPSIIGRRNAVLIGTDGAEADDVIGVIRDHVRERWPGRPVVIISNDNDCIQLVDDNTCVVNLFLQDVGSRRGPLTPRQYLRCRVLSGDRSDNIPSIVPRCGPKTAARLVTEHDEDALAEMYKNTSYARNDLIMNLRNTPGELKAEIEMQFAAFDGGGGE